ncbi:OmpA family protein [Tenacibaculum maritimum]|uniref:OmpA family protein n=1 Tax=Tenacibaculum maritimum TaxID=107401 RepID=UPI0012E4B660|nr:OmpA family protein [Tenacibaculum maritimum]MCD9583766.1 OmpA family protein [Tenacibaculum maritimum]MCD9619494.1 OmpA family protein [Tenacibaculum maritimum]MCD9626164.1 OmpA family protein [Tenacibaculum maritimum]MCD9629156.1 OmpA family protein [Tenacibaculum maritimum]MCD9631623.1 OmpA family protein [Tenacibaculum maritimum]
MPTIKTFEQGAKILQNTDVSSIVTGLALGIAEAQERLDNNSVKQITRLSETAIGGKSLLELGFQPAFYAFEYADVSASINLKMAIQEEFEIDFSLAYDATKKKGYTDEHIQKIENSYKEEKYREFKSSRKYWTTLSNEHTLKVNQTTVSTSTEVGSINRIEETAEKLSSDSQIDRVDSQVIETKDVESTDHTNEVKVHNYNGFGMLSLMDYYTEDIGILKIKDYTGLSTGGSIALNSSLTLRGSTLSDNLTAIGSSSFKLGVKDNDHLEVYFAFSKHHALDFAYSQGGSPNNTDFLKEKLRALAFIMMNDTAVSVKVTGHTDSVSGDTFNKDLGLKRANTVKNYLIGLGVNEAQITEIDSEGEQLAKVNIGNDKNDPVYRKAVIQVDTNGNDYIFVAGGDFDFTNSEAIADWNAVNFGILQKYEKTDSTTITKKLKVQSGVSDVSVDKTVKSLTDIETELNNTNKFYAQVSGDIVYLLRKDAKIEYTLFSNSNEEITIEDTSTSTQNLSNNNDTLEIHKVINSKYFAKSDLKSIKDPKISAWSGSLDVRYARQFGMSVEGNASVSARMVAVPPPTGLENYIQTVSGNVTNSSGN